MIFSFIWFCGVFGTLHSLTYPETQFRNAMVGEGLGKDLEQYDEGYGNSDSPTVVSVGDFVLDKVVPPPEVPEDVVEEWESEEWYPEEGESVSVSPDPSVERYVEEKYPGGKAANQALAASLAGADSIFLGCTAWSEDKMAYMIDGGVDVSNVEFVDGTGNEAYAFVDEDGENRIAADISQGTPRDYIERQKEVILDADYLLLSNGMPTQSLEAVIEILENGELSPEVILDPSPTEGISSILSSDAINYSTPNTVEHEKLYKDRQFNHTVLKTSAQGVKIGNNFVETQEVDEVVDTTAAGDTFNGNLAANLSKGKELEEAVKKAGEAAAHSVQKNGAQPSIPRPDQIQW